MLLKINTFCNLLTTIPAFQSGIFYFQICETKKINPSAITAEGFQPKPCRIVKFLYYITTFLI